MSLKPNPAEYPARLEAYIGLTEEDSLISLLRKDRNCTHNFFKDISKDTINYRYAEGKWSIKEILVHINYVERIMQYRALAASRGDNMVHLSMINHEAYIQNSDTAQMDIDDLLEEFNVIRNYTIEFFSGLTERQMLLKMGSEGDSVSARAIGYALLGHARHHMNIINDRYLSKQTKFTEESIKNE